MKVIVLFLSAALVVFGATIPPEGQKILEAASSAVFPNGTTAGDLKWNKGAHHFQTNKDFSTTEGDDLFVDPKSLGLDPTSQQYSGYIGPGDHQLFFWMFMSRRDPANDPVVLWLNGGPGCSSLYGTLTQWGPKLINLRGKLEANKYTPIGKATWIFLEQPVNVGYSTAQEWVSDTPAAGVDVLKFLQKFLDTKFAIPGQPEKITLRNNEFHLTGESYAGHYVPNIASQIIRSNRNAPDREQIKLRSIMVGNAFIDVQYNVDAAMEMMCGPNYSRSWPAPSAAQCATAIANMGLCHQQLHRGRTIYGECTTVSGYCGVNSPPQLSELIERDVYDLENRRRPGEPRNPIEAPGGYLETYVRSIRKDIGASALVPGWETCRSHMVGMFKMTGDWCLDSSVWFNEVLQDDAKTNVRVLLYAGDIDLQVAHLGVKEAASRFNWKFQNQFQYGIRLPETTWRNLTNPKVYGRYVRYDRLTYARIFGAGHMINEKKPAEALDLFEKWIHNPGAFE